MHDLPDDMVLISGAKRAIGFARDTSGALRAKEMLDSNEVPDTDKAAFATWMQYICDTGKFPRSDKFGKERGEIWAFKGRMYRIAAFQDGKYIMLTHGFKKQKRKWPKRELETAERIRREHMEWASTRG